MAITRYGIISDTHDNVNTVRPALSVLRNRGISKVIANGDIGGNPGYLARVAAEIGMSGMDAVLLPGSHEEAQYFEQVVDYMTNTFPNITNPFTTPLLKERDHHLLFIPGSDWHISDVVGNGYDISDKVNTGDPDQDEPSRIEAVYSRPRGAHIPKRRVTNIRDLAEFIEEPDKTIAVCHIPRKFNDVEQGVDYAYFAENLGGL